jgi:DNA-binding LytR/AlgR family response regulator
LKSLITDDERLARERLKEFLSNELDIEIIGEAKNGLEAVELIKKLKPDLIFLDIQMPGINGFEVLNKLDEIPLVIFVTAYDEYAIKAFEVNAIDYLLKPFSKIRFSKAIEKVKEYYKNKLEFNDKIKELLKIVNTEQKKYLEKVPVKDREKIKLIDAKEIIWIDVKNKIVSLHTETGRLFVDFTMEEFQEKLNPEIFFRAHRQSIVNLNYISELQSWFAGKYKMILKDKNKTELTLSRSQVKKLKKKLKWE